MRYSDAEKIAHYLRQRAEADTELRALGVDLPGDAPPPPAAPAPVLPWRPSWEMIAAARMSFSNGLEWSPSDERISAALSAAAAVAPKPAVPAGNLPPEPTEEMLDAAQRAAHPDLTVREAMRAMIRAALAVAPRAEIPKVTQSDVEHAVKLWHDTEGLLDDQLRIILACFRARWQERMGQS